MSSLSRCKCAHHLFMPGLIVLIALVLLAGNLGWLSSSLVGILWPVGLALIGLMKMCSHKCACCCSCGCTCCTSKGGDAAGGGSGPSC